MSALKTPDFWYRPDTQEPSLTERALTPVTRLYDFLRRLHQSTITPYKANIPVLCLGNIVAGGTGKTPTALAFMNLIKNTNLAHKPCFLLRGYGGAEAGPLLVDPEIHTSWDVGDEALMLAKLAPTIVSADRAEGAKLAQRKGADLIIMDDGLQNPGIHKDLKIMVINGEMGFGNTKLIPAGPLRQPLLEGLKMADAYLLIGDDTRGIAPKLPPEKPLIKANLIQQPAEKPIEKNARYLAFAGLGYPEKFFTFLKKDAGLNIVETIPFSDHFPYEESDISNLKSRAESLNARLITTEKDYMRLPKEAHDSVIVMPVAIAFDDPVMLTKLIQDTTKQA